MNLDTTPIFTKNLHSTSDIIINRGGTRSSKTYSLAQLIILRMISEPDKRILIARKTFPALRMSVYKDVIDILKQHDLYNLGTHNRTEHVFTYPNGSQIWFGSVDDPQKYRGAEWNYVWLNEANEFTKEDFDQLYLRLSRTSKDGLDNRIYLDFNPSDMFSWIKTELEDKGKGEVIHSTYMDNTFLDGKTIQRINSYREDPMFWKIYGLGEWGRVYGLIYDNYEISALDPEPRQVWYGLDWGYTNDPTALIRINKIQDKLYVKELIYETNLTNQDIIKRLKVLGIDKTAEIFADSAEPKSIEEVYRSGYNIKPVAKGADSIVRGIDVVKRWRMIIHKESVNLVKELRSYKWMEDKEGKTLNKPIDAYNDGLDAIRYAIESKLGKPKSKSWVDHL